MHWIIDLLSWETTLYGILFTGCLYLIYRVATNPHKDFSDW